MATRRPLTHPALLGLAIAISLAGCAGLPDQRLANQALQNGDTELAQQNFQQLADLGYADAQIGLADIQVNTGDPEAMRKAEAIYRAAAQTSPVPRHGWGACWPPSPAAPLPNSTKPKAG